MDFVLDFKKVVDYFRICNNDINEFDYIMNACNNCFNLTFKTRMSNLTRGKLIVLLMF